MVDFVKLYLEDAGSTLAAFTNVKAIFPATPPEVRTMNTLSKEQADELAKYKRTSAALRKKLAAAAVPDESEILPVNGKIHLALTGKPLNFEQQKALFGESVFSAAVMRELADDGA